MPPNYCPALWRPRRSASYSWPKSGATKARKISFCSRICEAVSRVDFESIFDAVAIHPAAPGAGSPAQSVKVANPPFAEAWPGEEAGSDFSLVEPASMNRREVK
jgi:hypothetical protein